LFYSKEILILVLLFSCVKDTFFNGQLLAYLDVFHFIRKHTKKWIIVLHLIHT